MFTIVLALVLLAHGIGHVMGPLQLLKVTTINPAWHGDSWLLTATLGTTPAHAVGIVLWTTALVGFAGLAGVVVGWLPAAWWQPLAVAAPVASMLGLLLFPVAFPTFSTIGALVVDVAVLVAVLWVRWTPEGLSA